MNSNGSEPPPRPPASAEAAAVLAVGAAILFWFDPARHAFYPVCLFHRVTGLDCPGCGGLRALHQLLHGQLLEAFRLNPIVVTAIPLVGWLGIRSWINRRRGGRAGQTSVLWVIWVLVVLLVVFAVARNLPVWPFHATGQ